MKCPKCNVCLAVASTPDGSPKYVCVKCGWESQSVNDLVKASPSCRLAELQAQGAEPGWYGPDGVMWEFCYDSPSMRRPGYCFCAESLEKLKQLARMCGFVEVPHD